VLPVDNFDELDTFDVIQSILLGTEVFFGEVTDIFKGALLFKILNSTFCKNGWILFYLYFIASINHFWNGKKTCSQVEFRSCVCNINGHLLEV